MAGKIRELRNRLGVTTAQLAYRLGLQQSTVVRMEQSEEREAISLETLRKAATALGCDLFYEFRPVRAQIESEEQAKISARNKDRSAHSAIGAEFDAEDIAAARRLSAAQRLQRSMQMSDFIRTLKVSGTNV